MREIDVRRIEVDEEVYRHLETKVRGFEQPNDVLRRELGLDRPRVSALVEVAESRRPGGLKGLVDAGVIQPGDRLVHFQRRRAQEYEATVTADGWVVIDSGEAFRDPSPALGKLTGTSVSGWANWIHERTGKTLKELRDAHGGAS